MTGAGALIHQSHSGQRAPTAPLPRALPATAFPLLLCLAGRLSQGHPLSEAEHSLSRSTPLHVSHSYAHQAEVLSLSLSPICAFDLSLTVAALAPLPLLRRAAAYSRHPFAPHRRRQSFAFHRPCLAPLPGTIPSVRFSCSVRVGKHMFVYFFFFLIYFMFSATLSHCSTSER
jgi:hypothetical protein